MNGSFPLITSTQYQSSAGMHWHLDSFWFWTYTYILEILWLRNRCHFRNSVQITNIRWIGNSIQESLLGASVLLFLKPKLTYIFAIRMKPMRLLIGFFWKACAFQEIFICIGMIIVYWTFFTIAEAGQEASWKSMYRRLAFWILEWMAKYNSIEVDTRITDVEWNYSKLRCDLFMWVKTTFFTEWILLTGLNHCELGRNIIPKRNGSWNIITMDSTLAWCSCVLRFWKWWKQNVVHIFRIQS